MQTVYVESNFVLELARVQPAYESCRSMVELAEARRIRLVIPAYSLVEPFETLVRAGRERKRLIADVGVQLGQVGRSEPYSSAAAELGSFTGLLTKSQTDEENRLRDVQVTLDKVADVLPLTSGVVVEAQRVLALGLMESPQDAVVLASVQADLSQNGGGASVFLNQNARDFNTPDVKTALSQVRCTVLASFDHGLARIEAGLDA